MFQYIIRRILWAGVMLVLVVLIVFVIFFVLPGAAGRTTEEGFSPVAVRIAGKQPTKAKLEAITKRLNLDDPWYVQFGNYLKNAAQGDLGFSYQTEEPVTQAVLRRMPATISLALGASVVWLLMGCSIGVISALRRRSLLDRSSMIF